jgi:thiamine-phosphate pyrophosphorylase
MRIVVISPEPKDPREVSSMGGFFAAGLERYHVRKPSWGAPELEAWLRALPEAWRPHLVLHQHHSLAAKLGLGGLHERDEAREPAPRARALSRSCHSLASLERHLGRYDSILFGPVFESLTKPGYGPAADFPWGRLEALLKGGGPAGFSSVLAIGGVTAERLPRCGELGFDGAAILGAVWNDSDPVRAFAAIRDAAARLEGARHAA